MPLSPAVQRFLADVDPCLRAPAWARDRALRLHVRPPPPQDPLLRAKLDFILAEIGLSTDDLVTLENAGPTETWRLLVRGEAFVGYVDACRRASSETPFVRSDAMLDDQPQLRALDLPVPPPACVLYDSEDTRVPVPLLGETRRTARDARERARGLLLEHLSLEEREDLLLKGRFVVTGSAGGRYVISGNGDVESLHGHRALAGYCVQWDRWLEPGAEVPPLEDKILATKLLLESDEEEFLKIANATDHTGEEKAGLLRLMDLIRSLTDRDRDTYVHVMARELSGLVRRQLDRWRERAVIARPAGGPATAAVPPPALSAG